MRWTINVVFPPVLGLRKSDLKGIESAMFNFDCLINNSLDLMGFTNVKSLLNIIYLDKVMHLNVIQNWVEYNSVESNIYSFIINIL